jgi:hypothetical protein
MGGIRRLPTGKAVYAASLDEDYATCPCGERIKLKKDLPPLLLPDGRMLWRELLSVLCRNCGSTVTLGRFLKKDQSSAKRGSWRPKKLVSLAGLPAPSDKAKPSELQLKKTASGYC